MSIVERRRDSMNNAMIAQVGRAIAKNAANAAYNYATSTKAPTKAPSQPKAKATKGPVKSKNSGAVYAPVSGFVAARGSQPIFKSRSATSTRISHRELLGGISGTSAFTADAYPLNPGISKTFPWLSTQAASWEQYKFHKLRFRYYSRCATTQAGSVIMAPDYDASDPAPLSEIIACSYRDCCEEVPWTTEFCVDLDIGAMSVGQARKYVRSNALAANLDIKTYDSGNMFLCTTDGSAVNWGKLWVEYDVELFVPQLPFSGGLNVTSLHVRTNAPTTAGTLQNASSVITGDANSFTVVGKTITFNEVGTFLISVYLNAASTSAPSISFTGSISFPVSYFGATSGIIIQSSTTAFVSAQAACVVTSVGATWTFNLTVVTGATVELFVTNMLSSAIMQ